ncbi:hypothetical protein ACFX2J_017239 [Malus domestica]
MDREVHVAPARVFSPPPPMDLSSTTLLPSMTLLLMNSLTNFLCKKILSTCISLYPRSFVRIQAFRR